MTRVRLAATLTFSAKQFEAIRQRTSQEATLEMVADWRAADELCFERPPRFDVDTCWRLAEHVVATLEDWPEPTAGRSAYALTHAMLTAADKGATPDQLREGMAADCRALPTNEAAMIQFEAICAISSAALWMEATRRAPSRPKPSPT